MRVDTLHILSRQLAPFSPRFPAVHGWTHRNFPLHLKSTREWAALPSTDPLQDLLPSYLRRWIVLEQPHGAHVAQVTTLSPPEPSSLRTTIEFVPRVDAAITDAPGVALSVLSADCVPLFVSHEHGRIIGIAHVGWRGAAKQLPDALIQTMVRTFNVRPASLMAALGPAIRSCCFEVKTEVANALPEATRQRHGQLFCDLAEAIHQQLVRAGVSPSLIFDARLCTACDTRRFHSYRREGTEASRLISWIGRYGV